MKKTQETKETLEIPDSKLFHEILQIVRVSLGAHRLNHPKYKAYKGKPPEEAASEEDAKQWIRSRMDEIEQGVIVFSRESEYPLLMAVYHVFRNCNWQKGEPHVVPASAARNLSRELADIVPNIYEEKITGQSIYGTPTCHTVYASGLDRMSFIAEEQVMEAILTLGEKHGLIIDGRRPRILPNGEVRMGFKFNKPELENRQSDIVKSDIRARIAQMGDWYVDHMKRTDPGLYHVNKGLNPEGKEFNFTHCI